MLLLPVKGANSMLIEITGRCLHESLENAVSGYHKLKERFPQVSGVTFAFDPRKPAQVTGHHNKMDDDSCPELGLTVQNHFKAINWRTGKGGHHTKHRQSLDYPDGIAWYKC
ncbi:hypothetical protein GQX74_011275 [Glossina fuscipes]|nr:hypothetical protein GQX74_011275 [Glossina fuscipes]